MEQLAESACKLLARWHCQDVALPCQELNIIAVLIAKKPGTDRAASSLCFSLMLIYLTQQCMCQLNALQYSAYCHPPIDYWVDYMQCTGTEYMYM